MAQGGSEAYSPRSFDWYPWTSVDHLITTSNPDLTYSRGFCSIIPVTTEPESQPRAEATLSNKHSIESVHVPRGEYRGRRVDHDTECTPVIIENGPKAGRMRQAMPYSANS